LSTTTVPGPADSAPAAEAGVIRNSVLPPARSSWALCARSVDVAHAPLDRPVAEHHRPVAGPGAGGPFGAHDRRQHERDTPAPQLVGPGDQVDAHGVPRGSVR
jgi:hypothetical protein